MGLTDQTAGVTLPEAQFMISDLSQSEPHVSLDWDDALKQDLVHKSTLSHLLELKEATKLIQSSPVSSVSLSDIAAAREASTCEDLVFKMIEVKPVSDGLEVGYTGDKLTLERAFQCGLIPASVYVEILQKQKTCQDMINHSTAENVSLLEPVQEGESCEVSRLILKCLSRNKLQTPGREVNTLKSVCDDLSDQETTSRLLAAQMDVDDPKEGQNAGDVMSSIGNLKNGDRLKVDAAVQCDLMSSSSALVVLGNQQNFMGLVLPHSEEIQTMSTSLQYDQQIITNEFSSSLFSNCEKIAGFYIPENSEVVDITSAVQNGLIDTHTAEVLKSVEMSDVFLDIDHLSEKFSSWLMYKKLRVDGCHDAVDDLEVNIPTSTEATQLFISYLMMNSYIDPKSRQRVLILDRQLTKMIAFFLEDSVFSENTEQNMTYMTLNVGDLSAQDDLELPLQISEETEEFMKNTEHTLDHHHFVSSVNKRITLDDKTYVYDEALKQDPDEMFSEYVNIAWDNTEPAVAERAMFQDNTNCTQSGEFEERLCENSVHIAVGGTASEGLDIPTSLGISILPTGFSVNSTDVGSPSMMFDSHCSVKSSNPPLPHLNAESLCSASGSIDMTPAEGLCSEDMCEGDYTAHLLKAQVEEGGIFDVTSGRRYDPEAAFRRGLVDDKTVLELLDERRSVPGDEEGTMSVLEQAVSNGSISSNTALCKTQQESQFQSACTLSMSESFQSIVLSDDDKILNLDLKATTYQEEVCNHSIPDDHNLDFINMNGAENAQQQPNEGKVADMVLGLTNEKDDEMQLESENGGEVVDCKTELSNYLHHSPSSVSGHEPLMISPSSRNQVTAECIHHTDKSSLFTDDSQGVINSQQTDTADVSSVVIEIAAPSIQSHLSSESDSTPDDNTDLESQTRYATSTHQSCEADSSPIDVFIAEFDTQVGNQAVSDSQSELDMFSSHHNVFSEETRMKNDTSAAQSLLDCEQTLSTDYSLPRDLVESTITSVSGPHGNYDKNITEDGSRITLPQQAMLHSDSDFSAESEPRCSQNGQSVLVGERPLQQSNPSSPLPDASNEGTTTNTVSHKSYDVDDLEYYTPTATTVSPDPAMTDKDLSGSKHTAADDGALSTERLSPERQHGDIFKVTSDTEQISVSRNTQTAETSDKQNADIVGKAPCVNPSSASDLNSGQSESRAREGLEFHIQPDRDELDVYSENPQAVTDCLTHSSITSNVASSDPSVFCDAVRAHVDGQGEAMTEGTGVSGLQKEEIEDTESTAVTLDQNTTQPSDKGGFQESDTPRGLIESSHPDLLKDLLRLSLNNKDIGNPELILQEENVHEKTEQSDAPNIQLQLLQVLKTVSSSQDLSMLQEVMETLNSALGGDPQEERRHTLESIKEESSEGEDDLGLCHSPTGSHQLSPQVPANSDVCKVEVVKYMVILPFS